MGLIHKQNKIIKPKESFTRTSIIKCFLGQLYGELHGIKVDLEKNEVPLELQNIITPFFRKVLDFADNYPVSSGRVGKNDFKYVKNITNTAIIFEEEYSKKQPSSEQLDGVVRDLISLIFHTAANIAITQNLYSTTKKLPIRSSDLKKKIIFKELAEKYQSEHGFARFPPFKVARKDCNVSERTYSNWKARIRKNTLFNYFPDDKDDTYAFLLWKTSFFSKRKNMQ